MTGVRQERAKRAGSRSSDTAADSVTEEIGPARSGEGRATHRAGRLQSLDALRGLAIVILLLAGNPFMREDLPAQLKHPHWHGLSFADLFFPLFLFVVGVAMTLSRRIGSARPVLRRVGLLALIGVGLSSLKRARLHLTGVLQHIAGAYLVAWLILKTPRKAQIALTAGILAALWAGYVFYAGPNTDPWGEGGTFAHGVDEWLIGRFSTEGTLQTISSAVTVLGGAFVGRAMKERRDPRDLFRWVGAHASWLIAAGLLMAFVVPINKRLWTPSFTILTIGTSCAMFALFIWLIDVRRTRRWLSPLVELGANPIAVYVGFIAVRAFLDDYRDSVPQLVPFGSETAGATMYSLGWLALGWLFAHLLYRRRVFVKI